MLVKSNRFKSYFVSFCGRNDSEQGKFEREFEELLAIKLEERFEHRCKTSSITDFQETENGMNWISLSKIRTI